MVGAEVRHVRELNPDQSQSRLVWVSDEDYEVRTQVAEALERDGFESVQVIDFQLETLMAAHSSLWRVPAAVVVDPFATSSGLELLVELRSQWWWVPIIVITECPDASTRNQARTLGCCQVFAKPLQLEAVRLAVRQLVS
jgi:DNA-binding response OmpR family regulator